MGVGYYALASVMPSVFSVCTATQPLGILSAGMVPLYTHLRWNTDRDLPKDFCILRLPFVRICLLCLEDVDGLARRGSRRVPILDLTTMQIRARRAGLLDSTSLGIYSGPMATLELTPIQKLEVTSLYRLLLCEGNPYRYSPGFHCFDCHAYPRCNGRLGIVQAKETLDMDKPDAHDSFKDAGYQAKLAWNEHFGDDGGLHILILGETRWRPFSEELVGGTC